jgi:hypothetical protein
VAEFVLSLHAHSEVRLEGTLSTPNSPRPPTLARTLLAPVDKDFDPMVLLRTLALALVALLPLARCAPLLDAFASPCSGSGDPNQDVASIVGKCYEGVANVLTISESAIIQIKEFDSATGEGSLKIDAVGVVRQPGLNPATSGWSLRLGFLPVCPPLPPLTPRRRRIDTRLRRTMCTARPRNSRSRRDLGTSAWT